MNNADLKDLRGAKCRIFGLGKSNEALASYLAVHGAEISVSDKRKSEKEITDVLQKIGIKNARLIPYESAEKADFVFRTPSIRPDAKEITDNLALGASLTSEVELFFARAKGRIYGITGSDGKTTTTSITYELLRLENPEKTYLGGNIGIPLVSFLDKLDDNSVTVCELSSFQLMTMNTSPDYSAITNISENHLDYHRDMQEYVKSKASIYSNSRCKRLVTKEKTAEIFKKYAPFTNKISTLFTTDGENDSGVGIKSGFITLYGAPVLNVNDIKIASRYNIENYMTAIGLCKPDREAARKIAQSFCGAEHRCEFVLERNGVSFYNSSIDSTPSRTLATLENFKERVVTLVCGGYDKNLDFTEFSNVAPSIVEKFIVVGSNKDKIASALKSGGVGEKRIANFDDFCDAVIYAANEAKAGGVVLLSPASASFDLFADFEERGKMFKNIVKNL